MAERIHYPPPPDLIRLSNQKSLPKERIGSNDINKDLRRLRCLSL